MNLTFIPTAGALGPPDSAQARFEFDRVELVLKCFKLMDCRPSLIDDTYKRTGRRRLTFASFRRAFSTFPVVLEACWQAGAGENCRPVRLFRAFEATFLLPSYLETYARCRQEAGGRPVGLIVPFDGYRHGMVVHNGRFGTRGTKVTHDVRGDVPPYHLTVEPFYPLLTHLARGPWTATTPLPAERQTQRPRVRHGGWVFPWMVHALGAGPDTIIFAWLFAVLRSKSGYDRLYIRRLDDGERGMVADHQQIAAETGLSERQAKRGLAALRAKGFIDTARWQGRTLIRVSHEAVRRAKAEHRAAT